MKKYPKYKNSGLELIGNIPELWEMTKLKYIGYLYSGLTGKSGEDFKREDGPNNKAFINFTNICNNLYISTNELGKVRIIKGEIQNQVKKGDLFFLMSSETQEDVGKSSVLKNDIGEVYLNSFCKGFRITDNNVHHCFLNYMLHGKNYRELMSVHGNGYTRVNLRQDKVNDFVIFYPSYPEQIRIANFLDQQTSIIDNLIQKKLQKIELLKEQRTSIINHAVTKGLNPGVEVKDSREKWLGEIPKYWNIKKLRYLGDLQNGISKDAEYFGFGFPFLNYGDVYKNDVIPENVKGLVNSSESDRVKYSVTEGDVFFTRTSESIDDIGISSVCMKTIPDCVFSGFVIRFRKKAESFTTGFSRYYFKSIFCKVFIENSMNIVTRASLSQDILQSLPILLPPIDEQNQIVEYLNKRTSEIDKQVDLENRKIVLLKEYRQSLISEVVTGKIDVRPN